MIGLQYAHRWATWPHVACAVSLEGDGRRPYVSRPLKSFSGRDGANGSGMSRETKGIRYKGRSLCLSGQIWRPTLMWSQSGSRSCTISNLGGSADGHSASTTVVQCPPAHDSWLTVAAAAVPACSSGLHVPARPQIHGYRFPEAHHTKICRGQGWPAQAR